MIEECSRGDSQLAERRLRELSQMGVRATTDNAAQLASTLLARGLVPQTSVADALHIALATTHGMDFLLTWNFKHIANANMRARIEHGCRLEGYEPPTICTPEELVEES